VSGCRSSSFSRDSVASPSAAAVASDADRERRSRRGRSQQHSRDEERQHDFIFRQAQYDRAVIVSDSFVIVDWTDPGTHPGRPIAPLHVHRSDDEAWIVLEGQLGFRVGEEEHVVAAGDSLLAPRGMPHSYWNPAAEPARYLLVMTPRIHRLIEALHERKGEDFAQIFEEHDSELLA
jgi:mannose-6-phosphate isomerase-like protein (cupin superfamily)